MDINLLDLKNLLDADKHSSDEDDQPINSLGAKLGPGSIGPKKKSSHKSVPNVYGIISLKSNMNSKIKNIFKSKKKKKSPKTFGMRMRWKRVPSLIQVMILANSPNMKSFTSSA
jgi:hypothetical protein